MERTVDLPEAETIAPVDVAGLARAGFEAIRWCLHSGDADTACEIAEALHNLPDTKRPDTKDRFLFQHVVTVEGVGELLSKYPNHHAISRLRYHIELSEYLPCSHNS